MDTLRLFTYINGGEVCQWSARDIFVTQTDVLDAHNADDKTKRSKINTHSVGPNTLRLGICISESYLQTEV